MIEKQFPQNFHPALEQGADIVIETKLRTLYFFLNSENFEDKEVWNKHLLIQVKKTNSEIISGWFASTESAEGYAETALNNYKIEEPRLTKDVHNFFANHPAWDCAKWNE